MACRDQTDSTEHPATPATQVFATGIPTAALAAPAQMECGVMKGREEEMVALAEMEAIFGWNYP